MKIILVICDQKGKNLLYVLNNSETLTTEEVVSYIRDDKISGVHVVETKRGPYIRSNPNAALEDNLDTISIPIAGLISLNKKSKLKAPRKERKPKEKGNIIYIDGEIKGTEKEVIKHLRKHKKRILAAAKEQKVDPYLLGAILIDEYLRKEWHEDLTDLAVLIGWDTSVGIAQVKVETAKELIKEDYYNPIPKHQTLIRELLEHLPGYILYFFTQYPKYSIYFAAAKIEELIKTWAPYVDLKKETAILGSLYSLKREPHPTPKANDRGRQIAGEFYRIAKKELSK